MPEWHEELNAYPDDLKEYSDELKSLVGDEYDPDDVTQDRYQGLDADLSFLNTPRLRTYSDLRQVEDVKDHIKRLPEDGETIHGIVSGRYPLFAAVPAILDLAAPAQIDELHLITLSYSKTNAADLMDLLRGGQIKRVWMLVSHYFAHANPHLYDPVATELQARGQRIIALRNHAKIILAKLTDGRKYVIESSANLRSCQNIEQFAFTRADGLYDFHRGWVTGLFDKAAEKDKKCDTTGPVTSTLPTNPPQSPR